MINKKLMSLLILPIALGMSASFAESNLASQTLQATLEAYLDITEQTDGAVTKTTIAPDTGNLTSALISKFKINSNSDNQKLYLQANVMAETGGINALFKSGEQVYVVFTNNTKQPTNAVINDITGGSPSAENNANAIAYPISSVALTNNGSATYDSNKKQYDITVKGGSTIATTTTGTVPLANTYSFNDTAGTYQAIMTLTSTSL